MAHHRLPLLCHTGEEYALGAGDQTLGDPKRLRPALEEGVTVIAAHSASLGGANGKSYLEGFIDLTRVYPHLYGDISALTQINRRRALPRLLAEADLSEHLVHGSDYPLPFFPLASPFYFPGSISVREMWGIQWIGNVLDRDIETKRALGVPDSVLLRAKRLLSPRLSERPDPAGKISVMS
jgi:predicted TIM-barrel fold metal-dependent hydrolase